MNENFSQTRRDRRARGNEQPEAAARGGGGFVEMLEPRIMMRHSYAWGAWTHQIGLDQVATTYPAVTGKGESIAVIDTGIDWNHPSLGNGKLGYGAKVRAELAAMGVFVESAAGNEGASKGVDLPGADPNVIAVSSVNASDKISVFSDTGPSLDLLAPGEAVVTTTIDSNGNPIYATL